MMGRTRYQPITKKDDALFGDTQLPLHLPVAVYYRQSTEAQIGNISTTIQTVDMVELLKGRGWAKDKIIMIDMDAGISGTTKIDEREGMSTLFSLITNDKIGAVACQDEDRLFRDITQIQVNIFIEACKSHNVLVITPTVVYNFSHPQLGTFHARQFRFKSEMAAEYIDSYVKGRLQKAKRRLLDNGLWAGPPIPLGFMIDMRKTLPSGSPNPNWRKLVEFQPFADVTREYFRLFVSFGGQARTTVRYINEHGPYFPNPKECQPPEGFKIVYRIRQTGGKWCLSRTALISMFTNAMYLGHWMVNGNIVHWDNHEAIIDEELFMRAFNFLSKVTLDGKKNPNYNPARQYRRPQKEEERPKERPLCVGLVFSQEDGEWRRVGSNWVSPLQHYTYTYWSIHDDTKYLWSKAADFVDETISSLITGKLQATFDFDTWEDSVNAYIEEFEEKQKVKRAQLDQLTTIKENLVGSLSTLTNPEMIAAAQQKYEDAQAEINRLQSELATDTGNISQINRLKKIRENCGEVLENWGTMTRDEKREVLLSFIQRIEANPTDGHGLRLVIRWKDRTSDEIVLPRQSTTGTQWLPYEVEELLSLVASGADQIQIARAFPHRKWEMIRDKYYRTTRNGMRKFVPKPIKDTETYFDYLKRIGGGGDDDECLAYIKDVNCSETRPHDAPG
ncbi:MAG: recombinase family protein [Anaerolineae bacterium]|nr:recombinase family protein [Anaerolineae bacterium]